MASKRDDVAELERADAAAQDIGASPRLLLPLGRGKTGKSTFVRWAVERSLERGGQAVIADADRTNATLSAFFHNVVRPPSAEDEEVRLWLNDFVDDQIERQFSAFLDLGGGDLVLKTWARDLELAPFLEANGITPIALHFAGCDLDDLSYLRDIEEVARFRPRHFAIVLNEGMVPPGRVARTAFEAIINHEVFRSAIDRGARVVRMPRLACMHEIERRRLSFAEAEAGRVKAGQDKIGPVARQQIAIWRREMERSFEPVASWIP
jgi:hypothetical protein